MSQYHEWWIKTTVDDQQRAVLALHCANCDEYREINDLGMCNVDEQYGLPERITDPDEIRRVIHDPADLEDILRVAAMFKRVGDGDRAWLAPRSDK